MTIDFPALAEKLLADAPSLLRQWFPAGKLVGREFKIGDLQGNAGESASINIDTGAWGDFATGETGGDLISLYAAIHGIKQSEAAKRLGNGHDVTAEDVFITGEKCHPIPRHKYGKPVAVYEYVDKQSNTIGYVCRFEPLNESKQFSPLTCWRDAKGILKWKWKKWPGPNPLYHADRLAANPQNKVLIVEGEKTADAAQLLLPDWIVTTWPGGAGAVKHADWSLLKTRYCAAWPDNDRPGKDAAHALKKIIPTLHIVQLPDELPEGFDLADAEPGFDVRAHINAPMQPKQISMNEALIAANDRDSNPDSVDAKLVRGASANTQVVINGKVHKGVERKSVQNVMVLTETDKEINECLIYNIFADDIFFVKCPPWEDNKTFLPHPLRDDEILNYRAWVETRGLSVGKNDAADILVAIARRNSVNPPHDYFETLVWDGKRRLDTWLSYYLGAESQNPDYLRLVGSKWLIAGVKRVYEAGCKFDCVLILEGDQYIGKSTALEKLATVKGSRYFTDESIDFKNKDSLIKLQGKLIFEMAELASFRKAETDEIKGFVRRSVDEYRPPYARKSSTRPRMFIIAGSVNPTAGYLTDPTGNTRYWPVKCGKVIDLLALERDKEQLWAEAVHRYKTGERIWLEAEEHKLACIEQKQRMIEDIMSDKILSIAAALVKESWVTHDFFLADLVKKMDIPIIHQDGKLRLRITDCLVSNGYIEYRPRIDGVQKRKWKQNIETDNQPEIENILNNVIDF